MPRQRIMLPLIAALAVSAPAWGKGSSAESGYTQDMDGRCEVWAPSMLGARDHVLRYRGGCKNGRAEGKGKAEWLYRWSELKVRATWAGDFRNGVFLDGQAIKGNVEPVDGDRYLVDMGRISAGTLTFISRSGQDEPMKLCKVDHVALALDGNLNAAQDDTVQKAMQEAGKAYQAACPKFTDEVRIQAHSAPIQIQTNKQLPNGFANARYRTDTGELQGYSNEMAYKARQAQQQHDYAQRQQNVRKQFVAFSQKNGIVAWVTAKQLDENPFRWEGRTVGVIVRMNRMLARDSGLVQSALRDWSAPLLLEGISPEFPGSDQPVLLAASVGTRKATPDNDNVRYVAIRHLDHIVCERAACSDWLIWTNTDSDFNWGEPFKAR